MKERSLQDLPDEILVEGFKNTHDGAYFAELFIRHKRVIFGRCMGVVKSSAAAEDLVQETFTKALTKIDSYTTGNFLAWLSTIALNLSLNFLKSRIQAHEVVGIPHETESSESSGREIIFMMAEEVQAVLEELSNPQRICLKLLLVDGYSYEEIGSIANYSDKEVKTHVQNGRRRFRIIWKQTHRDKAGAL